MGWLRIESLPWVCASANCCFLLPFCQQSQLQMQYAQLPSHGARAPTTTHALGVPMTVHVSVTVPVSPTQSGILKKAAKDLLVG